MRRFGYKRPVVWWATTVRSVRAVLPGRDGPFDGPADESVPVCPGGVLDEGQPRIVVLSGGIGAGHDHASQELARRLRQQGFQVDCIDLLGAMPRGSGRLICAVYRRMLRVAPWSYHALFRLACRFPGAAPCTRALVRPLRSRVLRLLPPDTRAVVSTFPLSTQVLGPLRRDGRLAAPAITYLTDFGVHPIWVSPGIDVYCAPHEVSQAQAAALGAADVRVAGRLVAAGFRPASAPDRLRARERFRLPPDAPLALLVAGSWGVGEVTTAATEIAATGVAVPVVVCARNETLRRQLRRRGFDHVLGWVDDMPTLMRAVDVLVENAGGLTALEGMASGLPVVTYRPIPGHGRANAAMMQAAGVVTWVQRRDALRATLAAAIDGTAGRAQRQAALALFDADPTMVIVDLAKGRESATPARTRPSRR